MISFCGLRPAHTNDDAFLETGEEKIGDLIKRFADNIARNADLRSDFPPTRG